MSDEVDESLVKLRAQKYFLFTVDGQSVSMKISAATSSILLYLWIIKDSV